MNTKVVRIHSAIGCWRPGFHLLQPSKPLAGRSDSPLHKDGPQGNTGRSPLALYDWEARRPRHYGPNILQAQGERSFYLKIKIWVHFSRRPGGVRGENLFFRNLADTRFAEIKCPASPVRPRGGNLAKLTPRPPKLRTVARSVSSSRSFNSRVI